MLKYQVRSAKPLIPSPSPSTSAHRTIITIRGDDYPSISTGAFRASSTSLCSTSNSSASSFLSMSQSSRAASRRYSRTRSTSMSSLSSVDSSESAEWGHLKVYTTSFKMDTDYKTFKVSNQTTTKQLIELVLAKFRQSTRDLKLYQLWMEVYVKSYNGQDVKTMLELDVDAKPLELQRCHPAHKSKFIFTQSSGTLVRIHDHLICQESNYKSLLISPKTTAKEVVALVLQLGRLTVNHSKFHLFLVDDQAEAQIPEEIMLAPIYTSIQPNQKIVIKQAASA